MDTLYIGDIPSDYQYARFFNGYIDLYNTPDLSNKTVTKYRIFTNVNGFYYEVSEETFNYYTYTATKINVTDNICSLLTLLVVSVTVVVEFVTVVVEFVTVVVEFVTVLVVFSQYSFER